MMSDAAFHAAYWILLAGILAMRAYFAVRVRQAGERLTPDRQAIEREGRGMFLFRFLGFFLFLGILVSYGLNLPWIRPLSIPFPGWLRWLGFLVALASLALWFWVQAVLGKRWSAQLQLRDEHRLETGGPYSRVRHPMYTAMFGWGAGLALVTANWIFVLLEVAVAWGTARRAPREEQMMIEQFGDEYRQYMQRAGRFFPRGGGAPLVP